MLFRSVARRDDQAGAPRLASGSPRESRGFEPGVSGQDASPSETSGRVREPRIVQVDNLKSLLVAWIIACHAVLGYTAIGGWPYDEVSEVTLPPMQELLLSVVLGPTALFVIGTFFFVAGLFAPVEMARHGVSSFVRTRTLRLGVPWLLFTVLVWPLFMWFAYRAAGHPLSYWQAFKGLRRSWTPGRSGLCRCCSTCRSATPCGPGAGGVDGSREPLSGAFTWSPLRRRSWRHRFSCD